MTLCEVVLDNDPDCVSDVVDELLHDMEHVYGESASGHLRLGIHEMLLNAIEHGNLEISAEEKRNAIETDQYDQLLADRRRDPKYATRRVRVNVVQHRDRGVYEVCIKDEGNGFDWKGWINRQSTADEINGCWRGIVLTNRAAESMRYNDAGNEVTLIVRVAPALADG